VPKFIHVPSENFILSDSALHYWPIHETARFTDQRVPTTNFTDSNITWGAPKFNGWDGAIFNGSNAYASAGDKLDVGTNNINFSVWVYVSAHATHNILMNKLGDNTGGSPDYTVGYRMYIDNSQWIVDLQTGATPDYRLIIHNTHSIPTSTWTHIAFTIDRSANRIIRYYLNGSLYNTGSIPNVSPGASLNNSINNYIGRALYNGVTRYFSGSMADCFFKAGDIWSDGDVWRIYKNAR
jgi:hypothetical protein